MAQVTIDYDDPCFEAEANLAFEYDEQYIVETADGILAQLTGE